MLSAPSMLLGIVCNHVQSSKIVVVFLSLHFLFIFTPYVLFILSYVDFFSCLSCQQYVISNYRWPTSWLVPFRQPPYICIFFYLTRSFVVGKNKLSPRGSTTSKIGLCRSTSYSHCPMRIDSLSADPAGELYVEIAMFLLLGVHWCIINTSPIYLFEAMKIYKINAKLTER